MARFKCTDSWGPAWVIIEASSVKIAKRVAHIALDCDEISIEEVSP